MGLSIAVKDTDGTSYTYKAKNFAEFTISDWRSLCLPVHTLTGIDALHEEVKRWTGIPLKYLRRLPPAEYDRLIDALVELRTEAAQKHDVPDPLPETIEHGGKVWTVPHDLEMGTVYGQWADLEMALDGAEHEPEVMAAVCACLLVEQGKEYEGYHATLETMDTLPAAIGMAITAFFLQRSERLRAVINRCMMRRAMLLLPEPGPEGTTSTSDTATGTD